MNSLLGVAALLMCFVYISADCSLPEEVISREGVVLEESKESYTLWESVSFTCEDGYQMNLNDFVSFCTEDGNFEPDSRIFTCQRTCSPPIVEDDTTYHSSVSEGSDGQYSPYSVVEFSCSPEVAVGYLEERVQPFASCNNGDWEPSTFPDCKVSCAIPSIQDDTVYDTPTPQNDEGYISHDDTIVYECRDGIPAGNLEGPGETICVDGQFEDTTVPDCKVACVTPGGLEPSGLTDHGQAVNFTCSIVGASAVNGDDVICDDGDWSKDPTCTLLCPGRDDSYIPIGDVPSRKRRSPEMMLPLTDINPPEADGRLVELTAAIVAAVTTATAVAFVTVVVKAGEEFSEIY